MPSSTPSIGSSNQTRVIGTAQRRVPELDGVRALAILPVILLHCRPTGDHWRWLSSIGANGGIGVSLFFVLSGYLITGILLDSVDKPHYYRNFITRRALRIFPLYYAALAAFVLFPAFFADAASWSEMRKWGVGWFFVYAGNLRQAWLAQWPPVLSFSPLWSLQIEEQYYLLFPWVVYALSRRNLWRVLIACIAVAPVGADRDQREELYCDRCPHVLSHGWIGVGRVSGAGGPKHNANDATEDDTSRIYFSICVVNRRERHPKTGRGQSFLLFRGALLR